MAFTDPHAFLRELRELDAQIQQLIMSPAAVCWHWPSYYLLYVDIDRMGWLLRRLGTALGDRDGAVPAFTPFNERDAQGIDGLFTSYAQLYKSVLRHLWQIARGTSSVIQDAGVRGPLRAHLHPKSAWYRAFLTHYQPGQLSLAEGQIARVMLLIDPRTAEDRIDEIDTREVVQPQVFDVSTLEARHALVRSVQDTEELHSGLNRKMTNFFRQYCTIDALLHPGSV